jgi:hypothetical protein
MTTKQLATPSVELRKRPLKPKHKRKPTHVVLVTKKRTSNHLLSQTPKSLTELLCSLPKKKMRRNTRYTTSLSHSLFKPSNLIPTLLFLELRSWDVKRITV